MENKQLSTSNGQLQNQSLTLARISIIEQNIVSAINDVALVNRDDAADEVTKLLGFIAMQVGITQPQNPMVMSATNKFIRSRFASLTVKEIILAFEMNAAGDYPVKHDHFQQLNMEYVGAVLNAYKTVKRAAHLKKTPRHCNEAVQTEKSGHNSYNAIIAYVKETGKIPIAWDWELVYSFMAGSGMVNETNDWKAEFKEKVREQMQLEKTAEYIEANQIQRLKINSRYNDQSLIDRCRAEYVKLYLKNHICK